MSKVKKTVAVIALAVLLLAGFYAGQGMSDMLSTNTAASIDVSELYENPESYDLSDADGAASIIIMEDLSKTNTTNAVTAVVFDFRGYDTLGESFVLFTAITGAMVILRRSNCENKRRKEAREA
ncbi:MAG: hypothetical protein PHC80_04225 [Eubacteriales bacterium]|nr:hypothetical protein [Eubacteriales bacterium]